MEHRGVEYTIVQAIDSRKWRWTVTIPDVGSRTGLTATKEAAAANARKAIGWLFAAKRRKQNVMEDAQD
jgi:hypothetical protein